ncbi:MAG: TSUP family transporter [Candidatus Heteroscillospira sp.]|jgi:uncharacterized membrane protein YfcA
MLIGFFTGLLSGMGVGGGTLLLVWLTVFGGFGQTEAQGINLLYFLPCAALALFSHIRSGVVDRRVLFPAALCGALCAPLTAMLATEVDASLLRRAFGVFLLIVGASELLRK